MKITDLKIYHIKNPKNKLVAVATAIFDKALVISGFQIFESVKGTIVGMPSRKMPDGTWKETVFCIDADVESYIKNTILRVYKDEKALNDMTINK